MTRYVYEGPQPHVTEGGECFRPLEVYEFAEEPPFGPFRLLPEEPPDPTLSASSPPASETPQDAAAPPPVPAPGPAGQPAAATPAPASLPATGTEGA